MKKRRRGGLVQAYCDRLASTQQRVAAQHLYCSVNQALQTESAPACPGTDPPFITDTMEA